MPTFRYINRLSMRMNQKQKNTQIWILLTEILLRYFENTYSSYAVGWFQKKWQWFSFKGKHERTVELWISNLRIELPYILMRTIKVKSIKLSLRSYSHIPTIEVIYVCRNSFPGSRAAAPGRHTLSPGMIDDEWHVPIFAPGLFGLLTECLPRRSALTSYSTHSL